MKTSAIKQLSLTVALLLSAGLLVACASTERQTEPAASSDATQPETQTEAEASSDQAEPTASNRRDRETNEMRDRDTNAVIEQLRADSEEQPQAKREPNRRPGPHRDRAVDQPRPTTRR